MKTCSIEDCDRTMECKGLCHMHYMRTRTRTPDKPKLVACIICGTEVMRHSGGGRKYGRTCSDNCKRIVTYGERCVIPEDHWARMYGATCRWYAPKIELPEIASVDCAWCGKTFNPSRRVVMLYCTTACHRRAGKARRRAREFNAIGMYTWAEMTQLWVAFGKACAYCAEPTALTDIQAEHVVALHCGGANNLTNLLPSCALCNSDKRDLTLIAWATDRARRRLPAVSTAWRDGDPRYKHLTSVRGRLMAA